jgi:hypothetical protein
MPPRSACATSLEVCGPANAAASGPARGMLPRLPLSGPATAAVAAPPGLLTQLALLPRTHGLACGSRSSTSGRPACQLGAGAARGWSRGGSEPPDDTWCCC